jgi:purine-cytosine permease-like protein
LDLKHSKLGEALNTDDHTTDAAPHSERRGPITLGLLWITMVTGFPSVLAGFTWYKYGLTLSQVLMASLLSNLILLAYCLPACHLATISGQTYALMSRSLFGRLGSLFISANVTWISLAWYGLAAVLLANGLKGVFSIPLDTMWLAVLLAVIMSVNNLFGFSGVANFAGYLAAPVLIVWIGMTFFKAALNTPPAALCAGQQVDLSQSITIVSALIIGNGAWGNEADYWRYARPRLLYTLIPLLVTIAIGQIVFPVTGWMLARETGITDFETASGLMTHYAFGGASLVAAIVLIVTYWGLNDANLYAAINGAANVRKFCRRRLTIGLTIVGALSAAVLSHNPRSLETVCSISSDVLPCATIIMMVEWFYAVKERHRNPFYLRVPSFAELPAVRWSAVLAFIAGSTVGIATAGIVPGLEFLHAGVAPLQAWLVTLLVYTALRPLDHPSHGTAPEDLEPAPLTEPEAS